MNSPRVFLICVNRLVCEAVNVLLRREGMDLLGMETDPKAALERIRALGPDVVLVEGNDADTDTDLMTALAQLAYANENLRIIRLGLPDGELHIYHQEQRRLANTQDLIAAVRAPESNGGNGHAD